MVKEWEREIAGPKYVTRHFELFYSMLAIQRRYMSAVATENTGNSIVCSTVYSDQHKRTSTLALAVLVEGNQPVSGGFPHQGPVTRKAFPFEIGFMYTVFADILMPGERRREFRAAMRGKVFSSMKNFRCLSLKYTHLYPGKKIQLVKCLVSLASAWCVMSKMMRTNRTQSKLRVPDLYFFSTDV